MSRHACEFICFPLSAVLDPIATPHFTLYMLYFIVLLYTPHFILYILHSTLHNLYFTLHTLHFALHPLPHSTGNRGKIYKTSPLNFLLLNLRPQGRYRVVFGYHFVQNFDPGFCYLVSGPPAWYRNFALEVRVCCPPVPTILSEFGGLINNY